MPRPVVWYLSSVELFEGISEEEMHALVQGVVDREYERRAVLYTPHDLIENVYILNEGEVTLYQRAGRKRIVLDILKPSAVFGNIGFDPSANEPHYAEFTESGYLCSLPRDDFLQLLRQRPDIALRALNLLQRRLSQHQMQIRTLSALPARARILLTVRPLNDKEEASILPAILRKPTRVTHEKLGQMTGLTRETVTKELSRLVRDGMVSVRQKNIQLTKAGDRALMAAAA
jgi:CRP/FNR family transcriptional regulator